MQDVLGGDGLAPDARLGKSHILRDAGIEMMADHEHVEMLIDGIDGVGPRRIGRGGQHVGDAARLDDVRRMAAPGALGMIGMDRAAFERRDRVLYEAALIQRVGVNRNLYIEALGDAEAIIDGCGRRAPVLVQLQPDGAGADLLLERRRQARVALAEQTKVHRQSLERLIHALDVPGSGRARGGVGAGGRSRAAANHGGDAAHERVLRLLRTDEVDVRIDAAGGQNQAFARDGFGRRANRNRDAGLNVGIAGLADRRDTSVLDADVGLDDAPVIENHGVGDDGIDHFGA